MLTSGYPSCDEYLVESKMCLDDRYSSHLQLLLTVLIIRHIAACYDVFIDQLNPMVGGSMWPSG